MDSIGTPHLSEHGEALLCSSGQDLAPAAPVETRALQAHWYAVQTVPRHEKRVREHLESRHITCFLPLYETMHRWRNGCNVRLELPLFPGYLFVELDIRDRVRVLEVPGVAAFVCSGNKAVPLPDFEIENLRRGLHLRKFEPHPYLVAGQRVRIKSGPLENLTGVLVRKSGGLRMVIAVELIKQSAAVEVNQDDIELLEAMSRQATKKAAVPGGGYSASDASASRLRPVFA